MDLLGLVIIAVLAYIAFTGLQFVNFKSKLMNEFGRRGVPFAIADGIFTRSRDQINSLHHSGMPINQIVDRHLPQNSRNQGLSEASASTSNFYDFPDADDQKNEKVHDIVKFVSTVLRMQVAFILNDRASLPLKSSDDWSIGYVAGAADAALYKNGFGPNAEGIAIMMLIFTETFGEERGAELCSKFMHLQSEGNKDVQDGMLVGGQDMLDWLSNHSKITTGWMNYVNGNIR